jgi:hypothetical protein
MYKPVMISVAILALFSLCASAQTSRDRGYDAPPSQPRDRDPNSDNATIPLGTSAKLSLQTQVSSKLSQVGDEVSATLADPIRATDGRVVIPRGTEFIGRITQVEPAGRVQKRASITMVFDSMRMSYGVERVATVITAIDDYANDEKLKAKNGEGQIGAGRSGGRTARNAGTGAAIGGVGGMIIGAAGGGLGGAAASAGAGAIAGVLMTKGNDIRLQPGTVLRIRFEKDMNVPVFESAPSYPRNRSEGQ